jgi:transcriptional regulator with XRE-family HTH domain
MDERAKEKKTASPENKERGERIRATRLARGIRNQKTLADMIGCSQPTISDMENGYTGDSDIYERAEEALGIAILPKKQTIPASDTLNPLRIMLTREKEKGIAVMTDTSIGSAPRPSGLRDVSDAYAFYVSTTEMSPVLRPGVLLLIHPHLPPTPQDWVVLYGEGKRFLLREFVDATEDHWRVLRYGEAPAEQIIRRTEYPTCHIVWGVNRRA